MAFGDPYVTRPELKSRLRIDDDSDDERIDLAVEGARQETEDYCKRQFNTDDEVTTRTFFARGSSNRATVIDDFHTDTGLVVAVGDLTNGFDTTWTLNSDFFVSPINQTRNESPQDQPYWRIEPMQNTVFPYNSFREPNLQVAANWGWASVPKNVKEANYILATRIFRRRDSPDGVIQQFDGAPIRVGWMMDPDAAILLKKFRKHVKGMFGS